MTEPQQVLTRLSAEFVAMSQQLARASAELTQLSGAIGGPVAAPVPWGHPQYPQHVQYPQYAQYPQYVRYPYPAAVPAGAEAPTPTPGTPAAAAMVPPIPPTSPTAVGVAPVPARSQNWIGKALAAAGVAVTLIGVVLLVVLAAQAGLLAPPVRVVAGAALAAGLLGAAFWLGRRPGGRIGAIALSATGIATAYIDVIAVTTIYEWVAPVVGLVLSAVIGGGGLMVARRWDSEQLGLLVLVPLTVLAPIVVGDVDLLLIGFLLVLSAAALPVQLGRDWTWIYAARTAAGSGPVLLALIGAAFGSGQQPWLAGAAAIAAVLAIGSALILLPHSAHRTAIAVLSTMGAAPLLAVSAAVDGAIAALMIAALSASVLAVVLLGDRIPGMAGPVRQVWSVLAAVGALVAVAVAFDGRAAGPVLLALAVVVAVAGRHATGAQLAALVFGAVGGLYYLDLAGPQTLTSATERPVGEAISVLVSSVLVVLYGGVQTWSLTRRSGDPDTGRLLLTVAAVLSAYAVTAFTVTTGVLMGGTGGGFLAGHMAATICWMGLAAALFWYAARQDRSDRSMPIGAGMALVAAAMAKLFLFDLGTLDGIFRVAVFIVTGLVLLGTGAGYARLLSQHDQQRGDGPSILE
ncbi:DUF2339 domain-containing protein [Mycolicibacterium bacteremicum]|uniref:DUF2339 domain-containing protein n=1 Tax=Mycolicibacterium bacteremicum TaxID=564198 RepID=A0A1W9YPJ1_MYCBA|nr:DUF2339 domain-containing protein [Mycolicibacterium bacteremicum]MCV7430355.1 DUF2339 domain-containing protein [Mycolicibacterium bacteremicum]ORA01822.1 hypothetical protein BST17_26560 [Mycolicibacterium bacteremicum]